VLARDTFAQWEQIETGKRKALHFFSLIESFARQKGNASSLTMLGERIKITPDFFNNENGESVNILSKAEVS